ncbi:MAG: 50S ribosomal protein L18 [bacterium]
MADKNTVKSLRAERRRRRVRSKIRGTAARPRLTVAKSLKNTFVQIIDDEAGHTVCGAASNSKSVREQVESGMTRTQVAKKVGEVVARLAKEKGIEAVVFDRNRFVYHGRIRAVADGAREGGLKF